MPPADVPVAALSSFRLDGQVAIVTGASSGLGIRAAKVMDDLGATVVLAARRLDRIEQLAATLARATAVECDVSERGASTALVESVVERHGSIDVVIANAGITNVVPALKEDDAQFFDVVNVDLLAPFELARTAAAAMRTSGRGGNIVMVGSAAAFRSSAQMPTAGYVAAKAGLVGLTRELARQWGRYRIRLNALCPGMYPSEMTAGLTEVPEMRAAYEANVPLGRVSGLDEFDGMFAFLATEASSFMTGQAIVADGGMGL